MEGYRQEKAAAGSGPAKPSAGLHSHSSVKRSRPGGAELGGRRFDSALPVLAGEHRAATLIPVGVPQR
jgi:hypothetical protein